MFHGVKMSIFKYNDYREFVNGWIELRPKKGRGELQKIAKYLNVHSSMVSHIFRGNNELSPEHGCLLAEYMGLTDLETDYFINLIQFERAGTVKLKSRIKKNLSQIKKKSKQIKNRLPHKKVMTDQQKAIFYSSWHYSAIRLLSTMKDFQDVNIIAEKINMPLSTVNKAIEFLQEAGICIRKRNHIESGQLRTHLEAESPFIWKHHQSWRIKSMERYHRLEEDELMFSAPLTINKNDIPIVRGKILQMIDELNFIVKNTSPDSVACLNIDWVKLIKS